MLWGKRYVDEFAAVSLPSLRAPGNLPALGMLTDLECLILTTSDSVDEFPRHGAFQRLQAVCPVRFIPIDDLVFPEIKGPTASC